VTEAVDAERREVVKRLGLEPISLLQWYIRLYGHQGVKGETLYEATHNSPIWGPARAPDSLEHRYLTEDLPYGLVPISELGAQLGLETPVMNSVITLASAALGRDLRREGRSLRQVGLEGLDRDAIIRLCETGWACRTAARRVRPVHGPGSRDRAGAGLPLPRHGRARQGRQGTIRTYIIRRCLQGLVSIAAVVTVVFFLIHLSPGNVLYAIVGDRVAD